MLCLWRSHERGNVCADKGKLFADHFSNFFDLFVDLNNTNDTDQRCTEEKFAGNAEHL